MLEFVSDFGCLVEFGNEFNEEVQYLVAKEYIVNNVYVVFVGLHFCFVLFDMDVCIFFPVPSVSDIE